MQKVKGRKKSTHISIIQGQSSLAFSEAVFQNKSVFENEMAWYTAFIVGFTKGILNIFHVIKYSSKTSFWKKHDSKQLHDIFYHMDKQSF